ETQANGGKADRRILGDAERAAEVEIAFGRDLGGFQRHVERGGDRLQRHAGAGDQRLEQQVAGTKLHPAAAGRTTQAAGRERERRLALPLCGRGPFLDVSLCLSRGGRQARGGPCGALCAGPAGRATQGFPLTIPQFRTGRTADSRKEKETWSTTPGTPRPA